MLAELGTYVNGIAKGDLVIVDASGFPHYDTSHPANHAPPAAPSGVVLRHGDLPGSIVARATSINDSRANIPQVISWISIWEVIRIKTVVRRNEGNLDSNIYRRTCSRWRRRVFRHAKH